MGRARKVQKQEGRDLNEEAVRELKEFMAKEDQQAARPLPTPTTRYQPKRRHDDWRVDNMIMTLRVMQGMSQTVLAKKVGVSRQTISNIENRHHEPVLSLGLAIAEALQTPVERVFQLKRPTFGFYEKRKR